MTHHKEKESANQTMLSIQIIPLLISFKWYVYSRY